MEFLTSSWSALRCCRNEYLQVSDGLLVTLNDEELAAEASEVHIIDHNGSLSCYIIDGLTINDTNDHNMLLKQLTPDK